MANVQDLLEGEKTGFGKPKLYWLRGSILGLIISGLGALSLLASNIFSTAGGVGLTIAMPGILLLDKIYLLLGRSVGDNFELIVPGAFVSLVVYMVAGGILGWVYSKIKSRRSLSNPSA